LECKLCFGKVEKHFKCKTHYTEDCNLCNKLGREKRIFYPSLCNRCKKLSIWVQLKKYINNFKDGEVISRQSILNVIGHGYGGSIDSYKNGLKNLRYIKPIKPGKYLKIENIPEKLTIRLMRDLAYNQAEFIKWFVPDKLLHKEIIRRCNENSM